MDKKLQDWVRGLSREQADNLLIDLLDEAIAAEVVCLGDYAPYWDANGEPLIPGEKPWKEE